MSVSSLSVSVYAAHSAVFRLNFKYKYSLKKKQKQILIDRQAHKYSYNSTNNKYNNNNIKNQKFASHSTAALG